MKKLILIFIAFMVFLSCRKDVDTPALEAPVSLQVEKCPVGEAKSSLRSENTATYEASNLYSGNPYMRFAMDRAPLIWLQFEGDSVTDSRWTWYNGGAPYYMNGAALNKFQKDTVVRLVADFIYTKLPGYPQFYRPIVNITTAKIQFDSARVGKRQKIIIGERPTWWQGYAGVAYRNSFYETSEVFPAFAFSTPMGGNLVWMAKNIVHELGHTIGLPHQSDYDGACNITNHYSPNKIMGGGWYDSYWVWHDGSSAPCFPQNDFDTIGRAFKYLLPPLEEDF